MTAVTTTKENPWKSRARPCPFYSQGRCLFNDSCTFRHDIRITVKATPTDADASGTRPDTPLGPMITIHSPRSIKSPPRSPRLQGLLSALRGVISDEEDEVEEFDLDATRSDSSSPNPQTPPPPPELEEEESLSEESSMEIARAALGRELKDLFAARAQLQPPSPSSSDAYSPTVSPPSAHSPLEVATVNSMEHISSAMASLPDSDHSSSLAAPQFATPAIISPASSLASLDSPSDMHSTELEFQPEQMLSPVFTPSMVPFPLFGFAEREDSFDSGYAESYKDKGADSSFTITTTSTTPANSLTNGFFGSASPPAASASTLNLLSSPFGSVNKRMSRSIPTSPVLLPYLASSPPRSLHEVLGVGVDASDDTIRSDIGSGHESHGVVVPFVDDSEFEMSGEDDTAELGYAQDDTMTSASFVIEDEDDDEDDEEVGEEDADSRNLDLNLDSNLDSDPGYNSDEDDAVLPADGDGFTMTAVTPTETQFVNINTFAEQQADETEEFLVSQASSESCTPEDTFQHVRESIREFRMHQARASQASAITITQMGSASPPVVSPSPPPPPSPHLENMQEDGFASYDSGYGYGLEADPFRAFGSASPDLVPSQERGQPEDNDFEEELESESDPLRMPLPDSPDFFASEAEDAGEGDDLAGMAVDISVSSDFAPLAESTLPQDEDGGDSDTEQETLDRSLDLDDTYDSLALQGALEVRDRELADETALLFPTPPPLPFNLNFVPVHHPVDAQNHDDEEQETWFPDVHEEEVDVASDEEEGHATWFPDPHEDDTDRISIPLPTSSGTVDHSAGQDETVQSVFGLYDSAPALTEHEHQITMSPQAPRHERSPSSASASSSAVFSSASASRGVVSPTGIALPESMAASPASSTFSSASHSRHASQSASAVFKPRSIHSAASSISSSASISAPSRRRVFTPPLGSAPRHRSATPVEELSSRPRAGSSSSSTRESPMVLSPKESSLLRNREARRHDARSASMSSVLDELPSIPLPSPPPLPPAAVDDLPVPPPAGVHDVSSPSTHSVDILLPAHAPVSDDLPLVDLPPSPVPSSIRLRPLRLSRLMTPSPMSPAFPSASSSGKLDSISDSTPSSPVASSVTSQSSQSLSAHAMLSSRRPTFIPDHVRKSIIPAQDISSLALATDAPSALHSRSYSLRGSQRRRPARSSTNMGHTAPWSAVDSDSDGGPASASTSAPYAPSPMLTVSSSLPPSRGPSPPRQPPTPVPSTPRPDLLFAIAADDPAAVQRALDDGLSANEASGPHSALAFAVGNQNLTRKVDIVKTLLAYGADAGSLDALTPASSEADVDDTLTPGHQRVDSLDPATRYYVDKAQDPDAQRAAALVQRSAFRPLARVRYDLVGQDRALEQLFRVLSMQAQRLTAGPVVVMLCGPSGHGKTLVAQKFGSLLDVPSFSVNMINVQSGPDLWQAYSSDGKTSETAEHQTLSQFLIANEGRRCVVVLDELEKIQDDKALWALHMPWETGRCPLQPGCPHIDVREVIWVATSNISERLVFEHEANRVEPGTALSRVEYVELMKQARYQVSEHLGAALVSRMTAVLPFVPFTRDECTAIAAEALFALGGDLVRDMDSVAVRSIAERAQVGYIPAEGARSLYRATSTLLMDEL